MVSNLWNVVRDDDRLLVLHKIDSLVWRCVPNILTILSDEASWVIAFVIV